MVREKLTRKELVTRYRKGERDFADVDLSGANLRGLDLRKIDLTNADLSHTKLQGTQFANATLKKAQFGHAKTGIQRRWVLVKIAILFPVTALLNFVSALFSVAFIAYLFESSTIEEITIIPGIIVVLMVLGMFIAIACQGLTFKRIFGNTETVYRSCQPPQHDANHGNVDQGFR